MIVLLNNLQISLAINPKFILRADIKSFLKEFST